MSSPSGESTSPARRRPSSVTVVAMSLSSPLTRIATTDRSVKSAKPSATCDPLLGLLETNPSTVVRAPGSRPARAHPRPHERRRAVRGSGVPQAMAEPCREPPTADTREERMPRRRATASVLRSRHPPESAAFAADRAGCRRQETRRRLTATRSPTTTEPSASAPRPTMRSQLPSNPTSTTGRGRIDRHDHGARLRRGRRRGRSAPARTSTSSRLIPLPVGCSKVKVWEGGSTGMMTAPPPDGPAPAFTQTSVMTNPSSTVIVIDLTSGLLGRRSFRSRARGRSGRRVGRRTPAQR